MADVYAAVDGETGQRVAIKLLRSVDPDQVLRFDRELDALTSLDHPAVVQLIDHGVHEGRPFLVLERCDGGTLAAALTGGALGVEGAAQVGADLAEGLAHAHGHGIVHRDVKPSNVLFGTDGRAKLADFGIARIEDRTVLTGTGWTIGTAAYLAPEQARGEAVGPAADVYSLGLVVLELATGQRAFDGAGLSAAMARLEHGPPIPDDLPAQFRRVVETMTAVDPADRPAAAMAAASLRELASPATEGDGTAVLPLLADRTTVLPAAAPIERRRRPLPSWLMPVACFAAGFLAVVVIGLALAGGGDGGGADPTTTTSTTVATTATAPTTTAPAPPPDDDEGNGNGNGNGNGRGRGGDD